MNVIEKCTCPAGHWVW